MLACQGVGIAISISPLKSANSVGPVGRGPDEGGRASQAPANTLAVLAWIDTLAAAWIGTAELAVIVQVIMSLTWHGCTEFAPGMRCHPPLLNQLQADGDLLAFDAHHFTGHNHLLVVSWDECGR